MEFEPNKMIVLVKIENLNEHKRIVFRTIRRLLKKIWTTPLFTAKSLALTQEPTTNPHVNFPLTHHLAALACALRVLANSQ